MVWFCADSVWSAEGKRGGWVSGWGTDKSCLSLANVSSACSRPCATCSLKDWMNSLDFLFWSIRCCSIVAGFEDPLLLQVSGRRGMVNN